MKTKSRPVTHKDGAAAERALGTNRTEFSERVERMKRKGNTPAEAERIVSHVIATKESIPAQIKATKDGRAFFKQGDIMFPVDAKDLCNVVGCNGGTNVIDSLMDSQVITLARANGLETSPYARELLRRPLTSFIQIIWYRDLEQRNVDSLTEKHRIKIVEYNKALASYSEPATSSDGTVVTQRKKTDWSKSYKLVNAKAKTASGRAAQLLDVMKTVKQGTLAQITEAARGKLITKQDLGKMTARFLKELVEAKAVEEVQS